MVSAGVDRIGERVTVAAPRQIGGEPIIAVDVGRTQTRAILLQPIEGEFRLVAIGRARTPAHGDAAASVLPAVATAIGQIERITGRRLIGGHPSSDWLALAGNSTTLTTVTSAAPYLPVAIVALSSSVSGRAAREATFGTYCSVTASMSADGDLSAGATRRWSGAGPGGLDHLRRDLEEVDAEAVLLAGGYEGGAVDQVERLAGAIAEAYPGPGRPTVVYAGCSGARERIRSILGEANLILVDNLTPELGESNPGPAAAALDDLYRRRMLPRLPGCTALASISSGPVSHSAGAIWSVTDFLADHHRIRVQAVDIGSASVVMALAGGQQKTRKVLAGCGVGAGAVELLSSVGVQAVGRWLQTGVPAADLHNQVARWSDNPGPEPRQVLHGDLAGALARSALRALGKTDHVQAIVATGGVLGLLPPSEVAMALLDGLQPVGICQLLVDREQVLAAVGGVIPVNPAAAASVILHDGYAHTGLFICPSGVGSPGKRWLRLSAILEGVRTVKADLPFGIVARVSAAPGTRVRLEMQPAEGADLGLGPGEAVAMETVARGLGLVFDCRGRPFEPPALDDLRKTRLAEWQRGMDVPL